MGKKASSIEPGKNTLRRHVSTSSRAGRVESDVHRLLHSDQPIQAVALAMKHGLEDLAAEMLARGSVSLARNAGDFDSFFEMVKQLGAERIARWPALDAAAIWAFALTGKLRIAAARLDDLEKRIPALLANGHTFVHENPRNLFDRPDSLTGMQSWVAMMRIVIASIGAESMKALELATRWQQEFPLATEQDRATVTSITGLAHFMMEDVRSAEKQGLAGLHVFKETRMEYGISHATSCAASACVIQGRVEEADALLQDAERCVPERDLASHIDIPMCMTRALIRFDQGHIGAALSMAERNLSRSAHVSHPLLLYSNLCVAVRALLALGRGSEALAKFSAVHFHGLPEAQAWWDRKVALERARTAIVLGESSRNYFQGSTSARDILEVIAAACRAPAPEHLRNFREAIRQAEQHRNSEQFMFCVFLKARTEYQLGQRLAAKRSVELLLTSPLSCDRLGSLAALAPGLKPMLDDVLSAAQQSTPSTYSKLSNLLGIRSNVPTASSPPEVDLSKRERQIVDALREGLSNREIAERLHVAEQTIKWHLWNLFQKLGVKNRKSAVRLLASYRH